MNNGFNSMGLCFPLDQTAAFAKIDMGHYGTYLCHPCCLIHDLSSFMKHEHEQRRYLLNFDE